MDHDKKRDGNLEYSILETKVQHGKYHNETVTKKTDSLNFRNKIVEKPENTA